MKQIALEEAEKASAAMRELTAADAEKQALLEKFSKPSGVSDEDRMARAAAIIRRAADNGLTEVLIMRFPNELCTDRGRAINQPEAGWEKTLTGLPKELIRILRKISQAARLQGRVSDRRLPRRHAGRHRHDAEMELAPPVASGKLGMLMMRHERFRRGLPYRFCADRQL